MKHQDVVHLLGRWSAGPAPAYRGLANALRSAIQRGDLAADVRLPAERRLARLLAVSRTTVVSAYEILRHEGLLESRQGSGTRVRGAASAREPTGSFRRNPVYRSLVEDSGGTIEFLGSYLPGDELVSDALLKSKGSPLAEIARQPGYLPLGLPGLRRALAAHVSGWGLPATEAEI